MRNLPSVNYVWGPVGSPSVSSIVSPPNSPLRNQMTSLSLHTLQVFFDGTPTACTYHLFGSTKAMPLDSPVYPADFQDLTGPVDGTTAPMVHVVNKAVNSLLIVLSSISGCNASFHYLGNQ